MTNDEFKALPAAQREGVIKVYNHQVAGPHTNWESFLADAQAPSGRIAPYVGIQVNGMFIGVEVDGYAHT